jgi:hypothetical protein
MRDENDGLAAPLMDAQQFLLHDLAGHGVAAAA